MAEVLGQVYRDKTFSVFSHRTGDLLFPAVKEEGSWLLVAQGHRDMGGVSQVSSDPWSLTLHRNSGSLSAYGDGGGITRS